jgi:SAM-dependent methyltransferase
MTAASTAANARDWNAPLSLRMRNALRAAVPWWAKAAVKLGMAYVPYNYFLLRAVGLARHGGMDLPEFAFDTFHRHYSRVDFPTKGNGFTALELGPGDSLFNALIAKAHGASGSCFVDVGPFAHTDMGLYRNMADYLRRRGLPAPEIPPAATFDDLLRICNAQYGSEGLASLRKLPDESFDFIFSNGVIQSIQIEQVPHTLRELRRLLRPGGVSVHSIELRDTMGQSLHHLRFSKKVWESNWFKKAGFHTNRLRLSELVELHREAGFDTVFDEINRWPKLPVPREKLARPYRDMDEDDLRVATVRLIFHPRA